MKLSLKAARVNANLTQKEVAERIGVSVVTYIKMENDVNSISIGDAKRLAKILGASYNAIFFDEDV